MSRENTSSIDMANGKKMAYYASQQKLDPTFQAKKIDKEEKQIVNAKKLANLANAKTKAKKRAKLAKASRKKNKR